LGRFTSRGAPLAKDGEIRKGNPTTTPQKTQNKKPKKKKKKKPKKTKKKKKKTTRVESAPKRSREGGNKDHALGAGRRSKI